MDKNLSIVRVDTRPHRVIAQENWGLTKEQMKGVEVHHRTPVSEGGTNDPANLFVCSPSMHRWGWHDGEAFIGWGAKASEVRDPEEHSETSRLAGLLTLELGVGLFGRDEVKIKEDAKRGGRTTGKLPWWYNPVTNETKRANSSPGEGWEKKRNPELQERLSKNLLAGKVNNQKWMDPEHPELGVRSPGTLAQMQARRGLPSGKKNRVKVG